MFNPTNNEKAQSARLRYVRDLCAVALGLAVVMFALGARADTANPTLASDAPNALTTEERIATSKGVAANERSITGKVVKSTERLIKPRDSATSLAAPKSAFFNDFEIFDARVSLYFDDDFDGHFYGIDVNFDADTDYASADVYAMLYLSLEGGPWELYYTTEVFSIFGDSGNDDFTVETELYSGYPTAYYDVLIELYDFDTGDFVAEFGPAQSPEMVDAPLEDQLKDAGVVVLGPEPIISQSRGGGGGLSVLVLLALALTATARSLRTTPATIDQPAPKRAQ